MSTASICKIMIKYFPKYYETLQNNDNDHSNFEPLLLCEIELVETFKMLRKKSGKC